MPKMKIKKNDEVIVISGKDKGKKGKVITALPKEHKVIVTGINQVKRHQKPDAMGNKGGIITKNLPIDVSNVAIVDPKTGKPTKIGYRIDGNTKIRFAKASGETI